MPSPRFKLVIAAMSVLTVAAYLIEPYVGARSFEELRDAPEFALATIDDSTFRLSEENNGTLVLLDFMATWCPPCREETQQLTAVRSRYTPSALVILTVDIDFTETPGQLAAFREAYSPYNSSAEADGWYFAMDTAGEYVGPKYGANALPTLVLVDGAGKVRHTWVGVVLASDLQSAIDAAFAVPQ